MRDAPRFDRRAHAEADRALAARAWQSLLAQEEASRVFVARVAGALERLAAPPEVRAAAARVASDEAYHVELCAHMVTALGFAPKVPEVELAPFPAGDEAFARAITETLVAGFAVAETMSVGGFVASRAAAREPLARWALAELARDEVRHGAFGELASAWALRGYAAEDRRALWPSCVRMMQSVEARAGGPVEAHLHDRAFPSVEALGAPTPRTCGEGLLRAVETQVLPRLARLGVLPT